MAPTPQRPFLSNFLAAFRAHTLVQKAPSVPPTTSVASVQTASFSNSAAAAVTTTTSRESHSSTTSATSSPPVNINPKTAGTQTAPSATTASSTLQGLGHFQPTRQHSTSPYSRSPGSPGPPSYPTVGERHRRGSDSSSEGFREALGAEKWYVGGRTTSGEERYYKLGVVKRHRSSDKISLDQLSI